MSRPVLAMAAMGFLTIAPLTSPGVGAEDKGDMSKLVQGNNAFACDLYGKLHEVEGNLFFSPYSISTALAMTYAGANGHTAEEMAKTLHFSSNQAHLHGAYQSII